MGAMRRPYCCSFGELCSTTALLVLVCRIPLAEMVTDACTFSDVQTIDLAAARATNPGFSSGQLYPAASAGHALLQVQSLRHEAVIVKSWEQQGHRQEKQLLDVHHAAAQLERSGQGSWLGAAAAFQQRIAGKLLWARSVGVCCLIVALCVFVACLKYGIDHYEDLLWTRGHDSSPWYTSEYMQLKVCLATLGIWIAAGMVAFTQIVHFNTSSGDKDRMLNVIEATYLCTQILTTVGYGDYTPARPEGQVFVASFILIGVVVIAVVFTEVLKIVITRGERAVAKAVGLKDPGSLNHDGSRSSFDSTEDMDELQDQSWASMQRFKYLKVRHENFIHFLLSVGPFVLSLLVGTAFYSFYPGENKNYWEAFYMSCITLTSVGFGAITPATKVGQLFASVWMLVGVGATANMIVSFGDWFFYSRQSLKAYHVGHALLAEMDADQGGTVDKCEYLRFELIRSGMCEREDIDAILLRFKMMDPHDKGIRVEDLRDLHEEPARMRSSVTRASDAARSSTASIRRSNWITGQLFSGQFFSRIWRSRDSNQNANAG